MYNKLIKTGSWKPIISVAKFGQLAFSFEGSKGLIVFIVYILI